MLKARIHIRAKGILLGGVGTEGNEFGKVQPGEPGRLHIEAVCVLDDLVLLVNDRSLLDH